MNVKRKKKTYKQVSSEKLNEISRNQKTTELMVLNNNNNEIKGNKTKIYIFIMQYLQVS